MPITSRLVPASTRVVGTTVLFCSIVAGVAIGLAAATPPNASPTNFDVFSVDLPDGWHKLAQNAAEQTWGQLDASRRGSVLMLSRAAQPFEKDPSTRADSVVPQGTTTLGGRAAAAYEWQIIQGTTEPLHLLVRCTTEPLPDGQFACAMAGVAGVDLETRRPALTRILDSVRLLGEIAQPSPDLTGAGSETSRTPPEPDRVPGIIPGTAALGSRLDVDELDGLWTGVWTRRPGTNIFDAVWRSAHYPEVHDVIRLEKISGNEVVFTRDGNNGRYYGTLSTDGSMISGNASWYSSGMTWSGRIRKSAGQTSGVPVQSPWQNDQLPSPNSRGSNNGSSRNPPDPDGAQSEPQPPADRSQPIAGEPPDDGGTSTPVQRETTIYDNWNTGACGLTNTARFALDAPTEITNIELWYNWRQGEATLPFAIDIAGQTLVRGMLRRGACDTYQAAWCVATAPLSTPADAGNYTVHVGRGRLCQNGGSRNNGFIRVRGMQ